MTKRRLLLTLLILNGILLPLGCVPAIVVFNMFNPMAVMFVTDISVTNRLNEPIYITPIGTVGAEGRRSPLPMYRSTSPAIPSDQAGGFLVGPGQTRQLLYDWDDINLSELVVRLADGTSRQVVVDPEPTKNQYRRPTTNRFVIEDLSRLDPVPQTVGTAAARAEHRGVSWLAMFLLLLPWISFVLLLRAYGRENRRSSINAALGAMKDE